MVQLDGPAPLVGGAVGGATGGSRNRMKPDPEAVLPSSRLWSQEGPIVQLDGATGGPDSSSDDNSELDEDSSEVRTYW